jgi:hypothetical protein
LKWGLDILEQYLANGLIMISERFDAEQQHRLHIETLVNEFTDNLSDILTRTGTELTAREANMADRLEQLETMVDRLTGQMNEVYPLRDGNATLSVPVESTVASPSTPPCHGNRSQSAQEVTGVQDEAIPTQAGNEESTQATTPVVVPVPVMTPLPLKSSAPFPNVFGIHSQSAEEVTGEQDEAIPTRAENEESTQATTVPVPVKTPLPSKSSAPSVPGAAPTSVPFRNVLEPSAPASADPAPTLPPLSLVAYDLTPPQSPTSTPPTILPSDNATSVLLVPAVVSARPASTSPITSPAGAANASPHGAMGESSSSQLMEVDQDPHETVNRPSAHPKIQRVPATPQQSQDTQATHITLLSQSIEAGTSSGRSSVTPTPEISQVPSELPALQVPAHPNTRSRSRSASENLEQQGQKRKAVDGQEGKRKTRRKN